jgi:transposase
MKITPKKVSRWRSRFLTLGMAGLERDASRPGRTPRITASLARRVVRMTTQQKPANAPHWSTRSMARAVGISEASVRRIWRSHGLKPHRVENFKISNDPEFAEKLEDIVGLYLNPPEHALVLCVDEKSQIQALDRTQPGLPLKRGRSQTLTHDYNNGTAALFAALTAANGEVYGFCQERHRHQEWLMIGDNYATHKHPKVQRWLARHPRFHMHFTPTSASWLNMVERFFRDLTHNRLRRGVFRDLEELIMAIGSYIDRHNENPKPFIWTARASDILEKSNAPAGRCINVTLHDALQLVAERRQAEYVRPVGTTREQRHRDVRHHSELPHDPIHDISYRAPARRLAARPASRRYSILSQ